MAWDPTSATGGISKNRLYKLKNLLTNNLTTLNQTLAADPLLAPILSTEYGTAVLAAHIRVGKLPGLWKPDNADRNKGGAIRIRVVSSDFHRQGMDFQAQRRYLPGSSEGGAGIETTFRTSIFLYFHKACFRDTDPDVQAEREEVAITTASDWLRAGVLNTLGAAILILDTTEYNSSGTDSLGNCQVRAGFMGDFSVGFSDGTELLGVHFLHEGSLGG